MGINAILVINIFVHFSSYRVRRATTLFKPPRRRRVQLNDWGANQTVSTRHVVSTRKVQIQLKFTGKLFRRHAIQFIFTLFVSFFVNETQRESAVSYFARNFAQNISEVHNHLNSLPVSRPLPICIKINTRIRLRRSVSYPRSTPDRTKSVRLRHQQE